MNAPKKKRNRAEQRAARQLAKNEGLSYNQALQRLRKERDDAVRDAGVDGDAAPGR